MIVSYRISCEQRSVTTNWISEDLAVLNGAATFVTVVGAVAPPARHPARGSAGSGHACDDGLDPRSRRPRRTSFPAPRITTHSSTRRFSWRTGGPRVRRVRQQPRRGGAWATSEGWDGEAAARDLTTFVEGEPAVLGLRFRSTSICSLSLPPGGGGLEHKNSTLLDGQEPRGTPPEPRSCLSGSDFVAQRVLPSFNVKRLRPVELGPFDFEQSAHDGQSLDRRGRHVLFRRTDRVPRGSGYDGRSFWRARRHTSANFRTPPAGWYRRSNSPRWTCGRPATLG